MRLSRTVFAILSLISKKIKRSRDSDHAPFRDNSVRRLGLAMINMHTKFEVSSLRHSRDILGGLKIYNRSRDVTTPLSGKMCRRLAGTCYDQHVHQI